MPKPKDTGSGQGDGKRKGDDRTPAGNSARERSLLREKVSNLGRNVREKLANAKNSQAQAPSEIPGRRDQVTDAYNDARRINDQPPSKDDLGRFDRPTDDRAHSGIAGDDQVTAAFEQAQALNSPRSGGSGDRAQVTTASEARRLIEGFADDLRRTNPGLSLEMLQNRLPDHEGPGWE